MSNSEEPSNKDLVEEIAEVWDLLQRKLPPVERRMINDAPSPELGSQLHLFERSHTITFAAKEVEARVRHAKKPLRDFELSSDPEGWTLDRHSAMALLEGFPALRLVEGYSLVTFIYTKGGNGYGETWAVPTETIEDLDASLLIAPSVPPLGHRSPEGGPAPGYVMPRPTPVGGTRDFMTKVRGDDTPWSYVSASFFAREAEEIGARWHGAGRSWHTLMGTEETAPIADAVASSRVVTESSGGNEGRSPEFHQEQGWEIDETEPPPERYEVSATFTGPAIEVAFYTYAALGRECIEHHRDRYTRGGYEFTTNTKVMAEGPGFIVT